MSPAPLTGIADCDIHPAVRSMADLEPWLSKQWIDHFRTYGALRQTHYVSGAPYHKSQPNASRRDAYPPEGGPQGSSLEFLRAQHLTGNGISFGILNPLTAGQGVATSSTAPRSVAPSITGKRKSGSRTSHASMPRLSCPTKTRKLPSKKSHSGPATGPSCRSCYFHERRSCQDRSATGRSTPRLRTLGCRSVFMPSAIPVGQ